jgi:ankyrin repeat protein
LQAAVSAGDLDIFRLLLSRGADVNSLGGYNNSALGAAAGRQHDTMLKELLEHGADPSLGESHALAAAAYDGNDNAVSILLDAGADLHFQEGVPGKALKEAASRGLVPTCKILLDRGADVNAVGGCHG